MEPKVVFEDEVLLVVDKPAGMVVNRATFVKEETVQDWVVRNFQFSIANFQLFRNGIVHRLDKETSGLLLIAKTPEAFENLQKQFKERKVHKKYLALVEGKVAPPEGEINAPVGRLPWDREKFGVFPGGRQASTKYKTINNLAIDNPLRPRSEASQQFTLLELTPTTGRTHQIRVHLKYLGYPIVGDATYTGRKRRQEERRWCPRMFLHAAHLEFKHPITGRGIAFQSSLPGDLEEVLSRLTG